MDSSNLTSLQQQNNSTDCEKYVKTKTSLKDYFEPREEESYKKKLVSRTTQVNFGAGMPHVDSDAPLDTQTYWKIQAEKKRIALEEALEVNKSLWDLQESLKNENAHIVKMLDEVKSFIEVFKEIGDDTGIDVRDVSLNDSE